MIKPILTYHYGPSEAVMPERRSRNGILYKLAKAQPTRKGGVIATYRLP